MENDYKKAVSKFYKELLELRFFTHNLRCELKPCIDNSKNQELTEKIIGKYILKIPNLVFLSDKKEFYNSFLQKILTGEISLLKALNILFTLEEQIKEAMKSFRV